MFLLLKFDHSISRTKERFSTDHSAESTWKQAWSYIYERCQISFYLDWKIIKYGQSMIYVDILQDVPELYLIVFIFSNNNRSRHDCIANPRTIVFWEMIKIVEKFSFLFFKLMRLDLTRRIFDDDNNYDWQQQQYSSASPLVPWRISTKFDRFIE